MLILLRIDNRSFSVTAPLNSAAYATSQEGNTLRIIFAMIRESESGIDTLNRVMDDNSSMNWLPVAARPEEQIATIIGPDPFVEYRFIYEEGNWVPATAALANFLQIMQGAQALPSSPPSSLASSLGAFKKKAA